MVLRMEFSAFCVRVAAPLCVFGVCVRLEYLKHRTLIFIYYVGGRYAVVCLMGASIVKGMLRVWKFEDCNAGLNEGLIVTA